MAKIWWTARSVALSLRKQHEGAHARSFGIFQLSRFGVDALDLDCVSREHSSLCTQPHYVPGDISCVQAEGACFGPNQLRVIGPI